MDPHDRALWARVLAVDETSHEYFAQRQDLPGAILFTCAPSPEFNLALLQQTTTAKADRLLDDVIAHYTRLGAATRVRLTPLSAPADWHDRLAARGFHPLPDEDELFLVLTSTRAAGLAAGLPANPEVTVRRVSQETAETDAAVFTRVQRAGFGMGEEGLNQGIQATRNALEAGRYRFYLACLGGEPVAAASAHLAPDGAGGVAGLYGLTTLPGARRQGVGGALVRYLVGDALTEGHDVVFLSAEPGSPAAGLYERMGFAPVFSVRNYLRPLERREPATGAAKG